MRTLIVIATALSVAAAATAADGLHGRKIHLTTGGHMSLNVPVSLPYDGPAPEDGRQIEVFHGVTGKSFPATLRDGQLTFVPEGGMPEAELVYEVRVRPVIDPWRVELKKAEDADAIEIRIDNEHFTTYVHSNENFKPYLWPVYGEGGMRMTRDWPMGEQEITTDHPHQKSLWTAYGNLNGVDLWAENPERAGYQRTDDISFGSGDAYGWIHSKNTWLTNDRQPIVTETREYRFYASPPGMRLFDLTVVFTADHGDVLFGDTKEGGLAAVRMRDTVTEKAGKGAVVTNAEGLTGAGNCWGLPSAWCDYSGPYEDGGVRGIAVFDHPTSFRHPSRWHVRDYGLMGANVFGLSDFTKGAENGDHTLKAGESMTFRYRFYVHTGDVNRAKVADRYADFATPPAVRWE